jgi:uncharacterized phage-associated protein
MTTRARVVANELLRLAREDGKALTPLQILKLVYIAHGWMLGLRQRPLISDRIEAWRYGPVIPTLYHRMKAYGAGNVTTTQLGHSFSFEPALDADEQVMLARVYRSYRQMTGIQLSQLTHQPGTPWEITYLSEGQNSQISNDLIAEHYRRLADERGISRLSPDS